MLNKDRLLSLVETIKQDLLNKDIYIKYLKFKEDFKPLLEDYNNILNLDIEKYNEFLSEIDKQNYEIIKLLVANNLVIDEDEIRVNIEHISNSHNNYELEDLIIEYKRMDRIKNVIEKERIVENIETILTFIEECFHKGLISINEALRLSLYLTYPKNGEVKIEEDNHKEDMPETNISEDDSNEIIVTKNSNRIDYSNIFLEKGYNYNDMGPRSISKLELYSKEGNVIYVLNFLNKYLDENEKRKIFPKYSKLVVDLIVYFDKGTIDKISNFLDNNNIKILEIMTRGSMFFKENTNYIIKDESGDIIPNQYQSPSGDFDSMMIYIEEYKNNNGLEDAKITDKEMKKILQYFKAPIKEFNKNLELVQQYGLVGSKLESKDESFLNGKNVEYILDRCVELGIEDYIKKVPSFLNGNGFPYKYYKIKRAMSLGEPIYSNGGLSKKMTDDYSDFDGISWRTNGNERFIVQDKEKYDVDEFRKYYEYHEYTPEYIFGAKETNTKLVNTIKDLFAHDTEGPLVDEKNAGHSDIIDILDNYETSLGPLLVNDNKYCFYIEAKEGYQEQSVIISRYKVIRLLNLLKDINIDLSDNDSQYILLSIIVKDSILSKNEYNVVKILTQRIINNYNFRGISHRRKN